MKFKLLSCQESEVNINIYRSISSKKNLREKFIIKDTYKFDVKNSKNLSYWMVKENTDVSNFKLVSFRYFSKVFSATCAKFYKFEFCIF